MSVQAECSHCEFSRRFSNRLAGRFFRCPRCREGVLAVAEAESEEIPLRLSSASTRAVAEERKQETEENTLLDQTALNTGERQAVAASATSIADGAAAEDESDNRRGEVATVRRILVECGVCSYHVPMPAEFFGKTIHCPECAGNTIFTESTLEPVKDELLDRLAMETGERKALFPNPANLPKPSLWERIQAVWRINAVKSFLVGVGLGLLVLIGLWGILQTRRSSEQTTAVERAVDQGWRYGANPGSNLFHEPWCPELHLDQRGPRFNQAALEEQGARVQRHSCVE